MRPQSTVGKLLLQTAGLVFLLNTVTASGACCFAPPESDRAVVSVAAAKAPCHQRAASVAAATEQDHGSASTHTDGCCVSCLSFVASLDAVSLRTDAEPLAPVAVTGLVATGIDPPFRPPITHLS